MDEQITYNGEDISGSVKSIQAVHDMYAGNRQADTLALVFEDEEAKWSGWGAAPGDTVTYRNGGTSTGRMYVSGVENAGGYTTLRASSIPQKARQRRTKSWESVWLAQIGAETASRFGFSFLLSGMADQNYKYIAQDNETDIGFLGRIARMEGGCLVAYDGRIVFYGEQELETAEPAVKIDASDGSFEIYDQSGDLYGGAKVYAGACKGSYTADPSNGRILIPEGLHPTTDAEAYRWAKGLLRSANKGARSCRLQRDIMRELSAGITVSLAGAEPPEWNGTMFLYHVRHEYDRERTTFFLRFPLEGY